MNREIKFRAIDEFSDDFIYGQVFFVDPDNNQGYIVWRTDDNHPVKKETVGQFTGLKDKNGVDIYEGDILRWKSNKDWHSEVDKLYIVKYGEMCLWSDETYAITIGFYLVQNNIDAKYGINHVVNHSGIKVEITGNIHQNKKP